MGLPFLLFVGFSAIIMVGGGGLTTYFLLSEYDEPPPQDAARCFPKIKGEVYITVKGFQWFNSTCRPGCIPDADDCRCTLELKFDAGETVRWAVSNASAGLPDKWTSMPYHRLRDRNLKHLQVRFGHKKLVYTLWFNSDNIVSLEACEHSRPELVDYDLGDDIADLGRCGRITVQKTSEKYLKLRSCSPLGLWWDLDDVSPTE